MTFKDPSLNSHPKHVGLTLGNMLRIEKEIVESMLQPTKIGYWDAQWFQGETWEEYHHVWK